MWKWQLQATVPHMLEMHALRTVEAVCTVGGTGYRCTAHAMQGLYVCVHSNDRAREKIPALAVQLLDSWMLAKYALCNLPCIACGAFISRAPSTWRLFVVVDPMIPTHTVA
jgi:hypothetical protein